MTLLHGAVHRPDHPTLSAAIPYVVGAVPSEIPNWFTTCAPDGQMHLNDQLSICCPVGNYQVVRVWKSLDGEDWTIPDELIATRYEAIDGWNGLIPGNDPGTIPQVDCFSWQAAPVLDDAGRPYPADWHSVLPADLMDALRRGPVLGTIGLTGETADDPLSWSKLVAGPFADYHRVVVGAAIAGLFLCRSYGQDYFVHPSAFVACDLMMRRG